VQSRADTVSGGWRIVAACFVVNFVVFGISVNTFTVYVKPLEADLGWSRGEISLAITLAAVAMGVAAPIVGRVIDRLGARVVMALGAGIVGGAALLTSTVHSLGFFYLLYVVSGIGQAGATLIPVSVVIANWFSEQRARALGIAMTGTGLGAMVMVPVSAWLVENWGWRISFRIMGCLILATIPLTLLAIRTSPVRLEAGPDGEPAATLPVAEGLTVSEALRTRSFWLLGCMMALAGMVGMGVALHLMPYLTDIGHSKATAASIIALVSGLTVLGKIGIGFLADRFGVRSASLLTYGLVGIGIGLLIYAEGLVVAGLFSVVWGIAIGAPLLLNPALAAECMGLRSFGGIFGILTLFNTAGAALGALLSGLAYDRSGSYIPAFTLYFVFALLAGLCAVLSRRAYSPTAACSPTAKEALNGQASAPTSAPHS